MHHQHPVPQDPMHRTWHIDQRDLKTIIRRYRQDLDGRNVDRITIVGLLAGRITESLG